MLWLFLKNETDVLDGGSYRMLHFAPERFLSTRLRELPNLDYTTGDLNPEKADEQIDITDIKKPDERFDLVLVSHVLEHVPDDAQAMRELFRVLGPGGRALLQHPVDYSRPTYEDWSITSDEERLRAFNQEDHVRIYGSDLVERLRASGFEVTVRSYRDELSPELRARHRLDEGTAWDRSDDIYVCAKPPVN